MTPLQLFKSACDRATSKLQDVPVTKLLNRMEVAETNQIEEALAQQFVLLVRDALARNDPHRKSISWRERERRQATMKTI
jgi:hypothetical protein